MNRGLADLKAAVDFRALVAETHDIRADKVLCPNHADSTPSCHVYPDSAFCFACQWHADAVTWLQVVHNLTTADAIRELERRAGGGGAWRASNVKAVTAKALTIPSEATPEARARWLRWWQAARPGHPLLRRYLLARGLTVEPPDSLRLAVWNTPVMLALVLTVDGTLTGAHLTFLKPDGSARTEKKLAEGSKVKVTGAAIRLYPVEPGQPLALTEGIETALAVRQATTWPVWACISADGLAAVRLPAEAVEVAICADHDAEGLSAAHKLARRLTDEGRKVRLAVPPEQGMDWLDALVREVAA